MVWLTTEADDQCSLHFVILCRETSCLTIFGVEIQAVEVDAQRHQHAQASLSKSSSRTDGQTATSDCITVPAHAVDKRGCRGASQCAAKVGTKHRRHRVIGGSLAAIGGVPIFSL